MRIVINKNDSSYNPCIYMNGNLLWQSEFYYCTRSAATLAAWNKAKEISNIVDLTKKSVFSIFNKIFK